jgi:hypothetical protein
MAMSIPVNKNGCPDLQAPVERAGQPDPNDAAPAASSNRSQHVDHAPTGHVVKKLPHELEGLADKWIIRRLNQNAWLFICKACADEYECTCFGAEGRLTPRQLKHLRYHRHSPKP